MDIMNNKPLLIGGVVVIGGVLFLAMSGSKGGGGTQYLTVPGGNDPSQMAASRDIQIAQIQAGAQGQQLQGQLAIATQQSQADFAKAQLQAQLAQYAIDADNARANKELDVNAQITTLQIQSQADNQKFLADQQASIAKYTLDQAFATTRSNNEFQLEYAQNANNSAVMMQQIQAQVVNNQLNVNRDITLGMITTQANADMAKLNANRDIYLASIAADESLNSKAIAASVQVNATNAAAAAANTQAILGSLDQIKRKQRGDVVKTLISGDYGYAGPPGPNGTAQIIGSVGSAAGGIAKAIGSLGGIF